MLCSNIWKTMKVRSLEKKEMRLMRFFFVSQSDGMQITPRWEPQEEGMMSTAASLPSVVKPRFIEPVGESQTSEG
jgi:murein endopeptidase